jgi:uncharacterized membrane protein YebE (DUF533 family)
VLGYARALLNAAAGDGKISVQELAWIKGYLAVKGYGDDIVRQLDAMAQAAEGKSTEAVVAECKEAMSIGTLQFAGKCIVFDAIRAASSDGLDAREKKVLTSIAQAFGIDEGLITQFVALVEKEQALKAERIALVVPGHPCLLEKYRT